MIDLVVGPFLASDAMQRALLATLCLSIASAPLGVFLTLRRMSLTGDAMSHAILPGVAVAFLAVGHSPLIMALGGAAAGILVALVAGAVSRATKVKEDTSLATLYLISLALGVVLVGLRGTTIDLDHILFGAAFDIPDESLVLVLAVSAVTIPALALLFRPLVLESADPLFFRTVSRSGPLVHSAFLVLVVINLVAAYQALGTLLAIGLMILPAAVARLWSGNIRSLMLLAPAVAAASSCVGLLASYYFAIEAGPSIVLASGLVYGVSLLFGSRVARTAVRGAPAMR